MSKYIKVYDIGTIERNKLEKMSLYLNQQLNELTGWTIKVKETYFDYSQNWKWTNLIVYEGNEDDRYQLLCPTQLEDLLQTEVNTFNWERLSNELLGSILEMYNKSYRKKHNPIEHIKRIDYENSLGMHTLNKTVLFNDLVISEEEAMKLIKDNMEEFSDSVICINREQANRFCNIMQGKNKK
jgi:hypothetical protein